MARCVPEVIREGKSRDQAVAQCAGMWDRRDNVSNCNCQSGTACQCGTEQHAHRVTLHAHQDGSTRREQHDGREHLVVPVVAVVEGVLNNNLVLSSEFGKQPTLNAWNGVPVPVGHPADPYGNPISANDPKVVENSVIGRLYRVHMDDDRLKGEIWIDVEKAERIGHGEVVRNLEEGNPTEVSTGYFAEIESKSGMHNNERYIGVHRNITPDHLAVLPDQEGACNWEDGCGAPRTHSEQGGDMRTDLILMALGFATGASIVNNESLNDRIAAVRDAVDSAAAGDRMRFVLDVFEDQVVFEEEGTLMRQPYTMTENGEVTLSGSPEQVRLDKQYVPINQSREDETVTTQQNQTPEGGAALSDSDKALLAHARTIVNERREEHIKAIMAHSANPYSREALDGMDYETLKGLSAFATSAPATHAGGTGDGGDSGAQGAQGEQGAQPAPDYSGRGGPAPQVHADAPEPLAIPGAAKAANG